MSTERLHDAHMHLQDEALAAKTDEILAVCRRENIARLVVNGTSERDWTAVKDLAERYSETVLPSFGLHPWYVNEATEGWPETLRRQLDSSPAGIGEVGLDRWIRDFDIDLQEQAFRIQIQLAAEFAVPLSIHCLKAWGKLLEVLESEPLPTCGFLLHSYGGSLDMIPQFADLGAFFSFSGHYLHPRKADRRDALLAMPRDRILLETDAPDMLPPEEYQRYPLKRSSGEPVNHPGNLAAIYEAAAEILGFSLPDLTSQVSRNFHALFGPLL